MFYYQPLWMNKASGKNIQEDKE